MKSIKSIAFSLGATAFLLSSCSGFLDKLPDERTEINTEDKVIKLLTTAYPTCNYSYVCELSSDNMIDNWAPHLPSSPNSKQIESHYNYSVSYLYEDEIFRFEPASHATYSDWDSPGTLWEGYYSGIATVNHALKAIDEIVARDGGMSEKLRAARAEAYLIRAYNHFLLVNIFSQAYKDEEQSKKDVGVPYVTEVEDQMTKEYERGNVADTYAKIQSDLEAGLADIRNINYEKPKWHFNVNAAHAFAARFYLYTRQWEKVIEHANAVLGTDSVSTARMMMDYSAFKDCVSADDYSLVWQNPSLNNNLMLCTTYSILSRMIFGHRYSVAGIPAREALMVHSSPLWSGYIVPAISIVGMQLLSSSASDYGFISAKIYEQFEYSDKIAGIGYPHQIVRAFTSNELLLERAEAEIMLGRYDEAARDLMYYWNNAINSFTPEDKQAYVTTGYIKYLTKDILLDNWKPANAGLTNHPNVFANWDFTATNVSPSYVIPAEAVVYMNCLNDFRRYENAFEGLRFFDLKRWGVEYTHTVGLEKTPYTLGGIDERRAIEVPWEAMSAGMESSRPTLPANPTKPSLNMDELRIK